MSASPDSATIKPYTDHHQSTSHSSAFKINHGSPLEPDDAVRPLPRHLCPTALIAADGIIRSHTIADIQRFPTRIQTPNRNGAFGKGHRPAFGHQAQGGLTGQVVGIAPADAEPSEQQKTGKYRDVLFGFMHSHRRSDEGVSIPSIGRIGLRL